MVSDVYWTLRVEIFFYLMVWLLLYFDKIKNIRFFLNCWLILSFATYVGLTYFDYLKVFSVLRYLFNTRFSFFFIAGCYFYLLKYDYRKRDLIYPILCIIGGSLATYYFPYQSRIVGVAIFIVIFSIFYYLVLKAPKSTENNKFYFYLGEFTYPLYLVHDIAGIVLIIFISRYMDGWLAMIIVVPVIIGFVGLVYFFVEKPLRKWLNDKLVVK